MDTCTRLRACIATFVAVMLVTCGMALPPTAQALSGTLVISQAYGGGGNAGAPYQRDFIELHNVGTTTVTMTGWSVQYAATTGTNWSKTDISGSIPPGGYFLIWEAAGAGNGVPLPTADVTGSISMSATAAKVVLLSSNTLITAGTVCPGSASVVDILGYGATTNCTEGSPTANLSNSTAAIRNGNGCAETDNNLADFTVATPTPRNSASPPVPCVTVHTPTLETVEWSRVEEEEVIRFHLRWANHQATGSEPTSGSLSSQAFGAFLPDFGTIGSFVVPPIMPESFFDVFFEVPLAQLPPSATKVLPGGGPPIGWPCPPDTIWAGNVDVLWDSLGVMVHVNKHLGNLLVNPGAGSSYIHLVTNCAAPAPWAIVGLCAGFNATLVGEDLLPAPNPLPAGWTGFIAVSSPAGTPAGQVCCFQVVLTCNGLPGVIQLCATTCVWPGPHGPTIDQIDWEMVGTDMVRFHLRWKDPDPDLPSRAASGTLSSQMFGAFLPDFGAIGKFDVPPIEPESFFDVFFEVPLSTLPPPPEKLLPAGGPPLGWPCPRDTVWAGNVDVLWDSAGSPASVQWHWTQVLVNPGVGASLIHVVTNCVSPAPWAIAGLCPGFNATLVNEDKTTPAPNPLPAGWTGYIVVSSPAGTQGGLVCCFNVILTCNGVPGVLRVCATTCIWPGPHAPTLGTVEWSMLSSTEVRFHLRWTNPDPDTPSEPTSGTLSSQAFGAFLPDFGTIGTFDVPAIMPESFFDVFFDVPLDELPPPPAKLLPGGGPPLGWPCPWDSVWVGNVYIVWDSLSVQVQVTRHFGNLLVNPGAGASLIHVDTDGDAPVPWVVVGLCAGFNATLVGEDLLPAPNPLPAGWTGFISVTSPAGTQGGLVCCISVVMTCNGVPGVIQVCATTCIWPGPHAPTLDTLEWSMLNSAEVRFHLRWANHDPETASEPTSGTLRSQEFGAFLPDFGTIGTFDVPPIEPESFFDVFFDVPLAQLPPPPPKTLPNGGPPLGWPCPPDTVWAGNVDVIWDSLGVPVNVWKHFANLLVNPGAGASLIHVVTNCAVPAPWAIVGLCPGFNATLVNENLSPAANPLPAGWTGFISVTSPAGTQGGLVCCFSVVMTCNGVPGVIQVCATTCIWPGPHAPTLDTLEWSMLNSAEVRFHLRWANHDPETASEPTSGTLNSQEFGAFLPDFGPIGVFHVPPIEPESFFDVFFDVPLAQLPPPPPKTLPNGGPPLGWPCPPDTVWAGNVDVIWDSLGVPVNVWKHFANLLVNPGAGASLIHVVTNCAVPAPWAIVGLCPGFNATLVNEDLSPAANPLPPNWTGFISVTSPAGTASGLVCCFSVVLTCNGVPGVIQVCAITCVWPTAGVPGEQPGADFGIRTIAPNPTSGTSTITFGLPRSTAVRMTVVDVSGKRVRTLIAGERPAGIQTVVWDGRAESGGPLPAGVYFLNLKAEGRTANRTLILLR